MARIRSTHPGQWTDEEFVQLSFPARILCLALRNEADDNGVFEWKPAGLKMRLLPNDNVDVSALLGEIEAGNQIKRFTSGGREYGAIRNFRRYQRPKIPHSKHPMPAELEKYVGLKSDDLPSDGEAETPKEETASQRKEEGGKGNRKRKKERGAAAPAPKSKKIDLGSWELDEQGRSIIEAEGMSPSDTMARVRDWAANAGSKRLKTDPHAFLRNWCRSEKDRFTIPKGLVRTNGDDRREYLGKTNIPLAQAKAHAELIAKRSKLKPANLSEHEIRLLIAEHLVTEEQVQQWRTA